MNINSAYVVEGAEVSDHRLQPIDAATHGPGAAVEGKTTNTITTTTTTTTTIIITTTTTATIITTTTATGISVSIGGERSGLGVVEIGPDIQVRQREAHLRRVLHI